MAGTTPGNKKDKGGPKTPSGVFSVSEFLSGLTKSTNEQVVRIVYTNWQGETSVRRIVPKGIKFESNQWHPEKQWLLDAYDVDKKADRSFAMKDIHYWTEDNAS